MYKYLFLLILIASVVTAAGCGGASTDTANTNTNATVILNPANMPPGLSASPLPINSNIPGIPVNAGPLPKGTTPTPGIPSAEELKRGVKKGTTPTPGIPDPETLRRSMRQPAPNANKPADNTPMMKTTNRKPE